MAQYTKSTPKVVVKSVFDKYDKDKSGHILAAGEPWFLRKPRF